MLLLTCTSLHTGAIQLPLSTPVVHNNTRIIIIRRQVNSFVSLYANHRGGQRQSAISFSQCQHHTARHGAGHLNFPHATTDASTGIPHLGQLLQFCASHSRNSSESVLWRVSVLPTHDSIVTSAVGAIQLGASLMCLRFSVFSCVSPVQQRTSDTQPGYT